MRTIDRPGSFKLDYLMVPNAETRAALAEAQEIIASRRARFSSADDLFHSLEENSGK